MRQGVEDSTIYLAGEIRSDRRGRFATLLEERDVPATLVGPQTVHARLE